MQGVRRSELRNAPLGEAARRKVEPKTGWGEGGAPSYLRRTDARLVPSLGSCSRWSSSSCGQALPVVQLSWRLRFIALLARGPVERPVRWRRGPVASPGDAPETRTGGAALPAVWRSLTCPCEERRRELADHRGTSRVQVTCHGLAGPVQSSRSRGIKVHGPCLPPCL